MNDKQIDDLLADLHANHVAIGRYESIYSRAILCINNLKKKPLSSLDLCRAASLYYPVILTQMEGEISESRAAELLGMDIVSLREMRIKTVQAVLRLLEELPSPLTLLLESMKGKQKSSAKNGG